jgi:hypothetical protein
MPPRYPAYPRDHWPVRLGVTALLLSLGILFGYGIPVAIRMTTVMGTEATADANRDANHFWNMVGGNESTDSSDLGRVAAKVRELKTSPPGPLRALQDYYVAPGQLPNLGDRLGYNAFDDVDPNNSSSRITTQGHFTDRFLLSAIQALGIVEGSSAADVMQPVPEVPSYGWLHWDWGVYAIAGVLALAGSLWLLLRRDRRTYPARARATARREELAKLSEEGREIYLIVEGLESEPASQKRDALLKQARNLLSDIERGLDHQDKLADLQAALEAAGSRWQFTKQAYDELPRPRG